MDAERERIQICRGFTVRQWNQLKNRLVKNGAVLNDEPSWQCAVNVFERRMRERFLSAIEALERADSRSDIHVGNGAPADCSTLPDDQGKGVVVPGFAIMALCCLLTETLGSFREARAPAPPPAGPCTYPSGPCIRRDSSTTQATKNFLKLPAFNGTFEDGAVATSFVRRVRHGILHEAETRGWVIWRDEPEKGLVVRHGRGYALNRSAFYRALKQEFEKYVSDLRREENLGLRMSFVTKMNHIVKEC